jgi:hypothetical protein
LTPRPDLNLPSISIENVDWEETTDSAALSPHARWARAERSLDKKLADLDAHHHGCRADLREGRLVWVDEAGSAVVEARAQILCTLAQPSLALTMAWADPMLRSLAVDRVDDIPDEQNLTDDESAREIAMRVADATGAEFVYRMPAPNVDYFLGLRSIRPAAGTAMVTPGTPVGLVLRGLSDLRRSIAHRSEPTHSLRARFQTLGRSLLDRSQGEFRDTEWVGRLARAGKLLMTLAARLAPPTFTAIAAGVQATDSLPHDVGIELSDALKLLEDEWGAFAL